jgi:hypothetical protein
VTAAIRPWYCLAMKRASVLLVSVALTGVACGGGTPPQKPSAGAAGRAAELPHPRAQATAPAELARVPSEPQPTPASLFAEVVIGDPNELVARMRA